MIISEGYSIEYSPNSNKIEIVLPQTWETLTNTTAMVVNRRIDINETELAAILTTVKAVFER